MSDYIKRGYAKTAICSSCANPCSLVEKANSPCVTIIELTRIPSADVAPVVRCEECKKWESIGNGTGICRRSFNALYWIGTDATDFCSFAERKSMMDEEKPNDQKNNERR